MKLIYDGDCGFCTKSAKFGEQRLRKNASVEIITWQSIDDLSSYSLNENDVTQRVYFITQNGKAVGGAKALGHFGLRMRLLYPAVAVLFIVPPFSWLAEAIYKQVAKNRHRMPGVSNACELD